MLDAAGRIVARLHAGANDVSGLDPRVYFVRVTPSGERPAGSIRKVVVAR